VHGRPLLPGYSVLLPIGAADPLLPEKAIKVVRRLRERPFPPEIGSEAYDKDAMPVLWNAIIRSVQQAINHAIGKLAILPTRVPSL
jgi:hypothetical protein